MPVEPRSGPVVITIEYVIRPEDILEFLAAMAERRRIRRRDGALNWRLLRDLADPQVWVERYETPTWLDYLRHTNRMTQHDAVVPQRLRALHRGSDPPRVRRMIERQPGSSPTGQVAGSADLGESLTVPSGAGLNSQFFAQASDANFGQLPTAARPATGRQESQRGEQHAPRSCEPLLDLETAVPAVHAPLAEVLAVVRQEAIAVLPES